MSFYSLFVSANPYVDFEIHLTNDELLIEYKTIDDYYLKDVEIINDKKTTFKKENEKIIIKNFDESKKLFFSYVGCVSETICQDRVYLNPIKTNGNWKLSETDAPEKTEKITEENSFKDYIDDPNLILQELKENSFILNILVFFLIGILLSFTPCIFPMLPIVSSIVIKNENKNPFLLSSFYALGIAASYAIIGLIMGMLNLNLQIYFQNIYIIAVVGILFILLGYLMISNYTFNFFSKSNNFLNQKATSINSNSYLSTFSIGFLSSLVISPCAAAPIIGILIYMQTEQHSLYQQISILFSLGLGAGVPLILISSSLKKILPKNGNWMNHVKNFFGAILFGVGIYTFQKITYFDLTGLYIIIALVYFYNFIKIKKMTYFIFSLLLLFAFLSYNTEKTTNENEKGIEYTQIENIKELENALTIGKQEKRPIFIDIYADWCTTCIQMEKETLNEPEIVDFVNEQFLALKIDITEINKEKQAILKHYKLQTAPAYIFYDKNGEIEKKYYIGFLNKKEFLNILEKQL